MTFIVLIPARLASTRLPDKALADLGGMPMIVRVAQRAALSGAAQVIVATDHPAIQAACTAHGVAVHMTRSDHPSGTDRIAEVAQALGLHDNAVVVNVQGDEPLINPELIDATAALISTEVPMSTAAHAIDSIEDLSNPNVVKVVLDSRGRALYFSRAVIPWYRDAFATGLTRLPEAAAGHAVALRHIGLYAFRNDFLQAYPRLAVSPLEQIEALEQLRVLWHGFPIAVQITDVTPAAGVDTLADLERVRRYFGA